MRKEYNDRWNAPLVNPGFTMAEYEARRDKALAEDFEAMSHAKQAELDHLWAKSNKAANE